MDTLLVIFWLTLGYVSFMIFNAYLRDNYTLAFSAEYNRWWEHFFTLVSFLFMGCLAAIMVILQILFKKMYFAGFSTKLGPEPKEVIEEKFAQLRKEIEEKFSKNN